MMASVAVALLTLMPCVGAVRVSPVQKVIQLLEENKVKITNDLAAEEKEMGEYSDFCSKEASEKGYAIKTAVSKIEGLKAVIAECDAKIPAHEDQVSTLASDVAGKEKDLSEAMSLRKKESEDFQAVEKDLATAVDQLGRAATIIKREAQSASFLQAGDDHKGLMMALKVINKVLDAGRVNMATHGALDSLLQSGSFAADGEEEYESIRQPQAKQVAYESKSGGIVAKIEEMKEKAEEELTSARNAEIKKQQDFAMLEMSINNGIKVAKEKSGVAKTEIGARTQQKGEAEGELGATQKAKAADEEYSAELKHSCGEAAAAWAERQESARGEMGAINKAIEILSEGVRVFLQVRARTTRRSAGQLEQAEEDLGTDESSSASSDSMVRTHLVQKLKDMSHKFGSSVFMQMAGAATSDPFVKIRNLIEEMIAKLVQEAQAEATQKAFCDKEMAESSKAQADKTMRGEKLQARVDTASSRKAELEASVKTLEGQIADLDKATAEATKIRNEEHVTYVKASKDFKDAATAVEGAIKVLKEFYDNQGSFVQEDSEEDQPELGGAKSDASHAIISILEMSGEDFTKLLMETETEESEAVDAFETLAGDNKVSKAAKQAEIKGSLSEAKSISVSLKDNEEDLASTGKELDAVNSYIDELKPQCETKVMSHAEKKARREAEIAGLKDALEILA